MPELNLELLEQSFQAVAPRGEELAARFYDVLFERYPAVKLLFAGTTPEKQQGKLLAALATIVGALRKPDELVPYLQGLGGRHHGYAAEPAH